MNTSAVDPIVRTMLYEGHILYPYRPSAIKNRRRFTFGRVYPRAYSRLVNERERWTITTECLMQVGSESGGVAGGGAEVEAAIRFLQPIERQILDARGEEVDQLMVDGRLHQTWTDVAERAVDVRPLHVSEEGRRVNAFAFPASVESEELRSTEGLVGVAERRNPRIAGRVELSAESVDERLYRIRVIVSNESPLPENVVGDEDEVLLRTFTSTHTILQVRGGRFLSMTDAPPEYAAAAAACVNSGTWPVLVGDEARQDTMLSSPIILYDFPAIAPESAGDFFDGTEIDEMLTLRVMTLSEDEKTEIRSADAFARQILHRAESTTSDDLFGMHGVVRGLKELSHQVPPKHVEIEGRRLTAGDRVRIRPKKMTDVMDVALAGKMAEIESINQDFEGRIHLALVIDDDPGRDLGLMRQPGHRFFYSLDDVEIPESETL